MFTEKIKSFWRVHWANSIKPVSVIVYVPSLCIYVLNDISFRKVCCGNGATEKFLHHLLSVVPNDVKLTYTDMTHELVAYTIIQPVAWNAQRHPVYEWWLLVNPFLTKQIVKLLVVTDLYTCSLSQSSSSRPAWHYAWVDIVGLKFSSSKHQQALILMWSFLPTFVSYLFWLVSASKHEKAWGKRGSTVIPVYEYGKRDDTGKFSH